MRRFSHLLSPLSPAFAHARPRALRLALLALPLALCAARVSAQDAAVASTADAGAAAVDAAAPEPQAPPESEEAAPAEAPASEPSGPAPVLEPPALTPLALDADAGAAAAEAKPQAKPETKRGWTLPETVFHLHGYLRVRGGLLKDGALGHSPEFDRLPRSWGDGRPQGSNYDPFTFFTSNAGRDVDRDGELTDAAGMRATDRGCGDSSGDASNCSKRRDLQVAGDMRLRLKPEIHLSDDIRVKAWIDVLDNVGLGTMGYGTPNIGDVDFGSALRVRRAWGEARNRDIGEIRFGRMGADWGLGILDNGGDRYGIDSDFSTDVDRVMGMTNLAGFYFMAAYDWAAQGKQLPGSASPSGTYLDRTERDDRSAVTAAIAHRLDSEVQRSTLLRGEAVFNYGLYFVWRKQLLKRKLASDMESQNEFLRVNQRMYIPDLWAQFLWEGLRVELEATFVAGKMEGGCPRLHASDRTGVRGAVEALERGDNLDNQRSPDGECKFRQLGVALEAEYRLLDDRLGIHFLSGLASGDPHSYGLAQTNDPSLQVSDGTGDRTLSSYQFHPDYRVDLILWRTLMRRVSGAYYFKPGISYDFVHDPYGQLAGARIDAVYSRAMYSKQTYGRSTNLGLELDVSLYYRSEDGPDLWDGFYTTIQWGILFPFQGLESLDYTGNGNEPKSRNAMIFRGVMGIAF